MTTTTFISNLTKAIETLKESEKKSLDSMQTQSTTFALSYAFDFLTNQRAVYRLEHHLQLITEKEISIEAIEEQLNYDYKTIFEQRMRLANPSSGLFGLQTIELEYAISYKAWSIMSQALGIETFI